MVKQDYIMRLIHEMIRVLVKLLFSVDTKSTVSDLAKQKEENTMVKRWLDMIDLGKINEAENEVYLALDSKDKEGLKNALLFYSHLNEKEDSFLSKYNYSREEIKMGLEKIAQKCGLQGITDIFFK